MYRHAPGTIWRRALARVDRRAAALSGEGCVRFHATYNRCDHRHALLREAVRLANRLAYCASLVR